MSRLSLDGQPKYTHDSDYITETLLEIYDVEEISYGIFPLKFTTIDHYQQEDPDIQANFLCAKYFKKVIFVESRILLQW